MKRLFFVGFLNILVSLSWAQRTHVPMNADWSLGQTTDTNVIHNSFDDNSWLRVDLPYSWNRLDGQDGGNNYKRGAFWYRKSFSFDPLWNGKKIFLRFGAANMKTVVYLNGQMVGTHIGGHGAFIFDITDFISSVNENLLAVQVDNSASIPSPPLSADFTFFGGITRQVELLITDKTFISPLDYASPGVYLTPYNISNANAKINAMILVGNESGVNENINVLTLLFDKNQQLVDSVSSVVQLPNDSITSIRQNLNVQNPVLWNGMKNPYLYTAKIQLFVNGELKDEQIQPVGIRTYYVDKNTGFYLNGESYRLHGVAMHEDHQDKGHAVSDSDRRQDLELVHEMGCNFIRLAHYQHGDFTYRYCDSSGMILWTEVPLINYILTTPEFENNTLSQLKELIKQNYNHPSIFFWGMSNEINAHSTPDPAPLVQKENDLAHALDSTRLTTEAAMISEANSNWVTDLISFNKYLGWYGGKTSDFGPFIDGMRTAHPNSKIGISEYGAGADIYDHQANPVPPATGGPFHPEEYQDLFHENTYEAIASRPYIWSSAIWVAFDFAADARNEGHSPGINDKGMITRDRKTKKDAFYFYKANWSSEPFVYISSRRFTERTDSMVEVKVYSNCDTVFMSRNGEEFIQQTSGNPIFKWENVSLNQDYDTIIVKGLKAGKAYCDTCYWHYDNVLNSGQNIILPGKIRINFQPASSVPPYGYLVDSGEKFGNRGNGYTYGWSADNTANTRERTSTSDTLFNTFDHMQKDKTLFWEIQIPNGLYQFSIGCGDPDYTDSFHELEVEGRKVISGDHTPTSMIMKTDTITISDGRLTITPSQNSINAKLNVVHLTRVDGPTESLRQHKSDGDVHVYYDAGINALNINILNNPAKYKYASVFDITGQKLYENLHLSKRISIDTNQWSKGLFIVALAKESGEIVSKPVMVN